MKLSDKFMFQRFSVIYTSLLLVFITRPAYTAVDQILNDNFFQNPAELSSVNHLQLLAGNLFISPRLQFNGSTTLGTGTASSKENDYLPYILIDYRWNDQWVMGLAIVPSGYGHLNWPVNSIVAQEATVTNVLYYRYGLQSSYQLTDRLALGAGINLQSNQHYELNFVIPGLGNELNNISGFNCTADIGLYYKLNSRHALTIAYYSPVDNKTGHGNSILNATINNNFTLNINEAAVAFIGFKHQWTDRWFLEETIYWSSWSIQKNIYFLNTTVGSFVVPTDYKDTWSFLLVTRYAITDLVAILGSLIYETNAAPEATNAIGYPLAASGALSLGFDIAFKKEWSLQILYSDGTFLPNSPISNATSAGKIRANFQAGVLQFIYKV